MIQLITNKEYKVTSKTHVFYIKIINNLTIITTYSLDFESGTEALISSDVPLRLTEARLLQLLLENPNRIVSKDEIMEKVWQNKRVTESSIRQVIYNLRTLLYDKARPYKLLHNFRCLGYTLDNSEIVDLDAAGQEPATNAQPEEVLPVRRFSSIKSIIRRLLSIVKIT